uniref:Uncharacterized protein n=1 Tax=Rhizophora mucronata TaxID=61149 RepID=A0A2P2PIM3_RHIMU
MIRDQTDKKIKILKTFI